MRPPHAAPRPHRPVARGSLRAGPRALAALGCLGLALACAEEAPEESPARPVVVEGVRGYALVESIQATGELEAVDEATLAAEVAGQVTHTAVDVGDAVAKGQVLIEIDRERRALELANERALTSEALESHLEMRGEAEPIHALHQRAVAADTRLDEVETQERRGQARVSAARAKLALAERALRDSTITAPFAGLIARRLVSAGDYVAPGQALV